MKSREERGWALVAPPALAGRPAGQHQNIVPCSSVSHSNTAHGGGARGKGLGEVVGYTSGAVTIEQTTQPVPVSGLPPDPA